MNMTKEILNTIREIYLCLADSKSKKLFVDRLLYSISSNREYVYDLLQDSVIDFSERIGELKNKTEIIIYGAGINCEMVIIACKKHGIKVDYICDRDIDKQGKKYFDVDVISPDELINYHKNATVVISTTYYYEEVRDFLQQHFPSDQLVAFANKNQIDSIRLQYFDEILQLKDGEVFVDCGCFDFNTSKILLSKCKAEKIYAFEPDKKNLERIKMEVDKMKLSNVEIIPAGMWSCNTTLFFNSQGSMMSRIDENGEDEVEVRALDEVVDGKVTFIKMDIEGAELQALFGAEKTIKKYKPKLAICIYHRLEDILEIPAYIHSIVPEYKFYIRHYSFSTSETVLYATIADDIV